MADLSHKAGAYNSHGLDLSQFYSSGKEGKHKQAPAKFTYEPLTPAEESDLTRHNTQMPYEVEDPYSHLLIPTPTSEHPLMVEECMGPSTFSENPESLSGDEVGRYDDGSQGSIGSEGTLIRELEDIFEVNSTPENSLLVSSGLDLKSDAGLFTELQDLGEKKLNTEKPTLEKKPLPSLKKLPGVKVSSVPKSVAKKKSVNEVQPNEALPIEDDIIRTYTPPPIPKKPGQKSTVWKIDDDESSSREQWEPGTDSIKDFEAEELRFEVEEIKAKKAQEEKRKAELKSSKEKYDNFSASSPMAKAMGLQEGPTNRDCRIDPRVGEKGASDKEKGGHGWNPFKKIKRIVTTTKDRSESVSSDNNIEIEGTSPPKASMLAKQDSQGSFNSSYGSLPVSITSSQSSNNTPSGESPSSPRSILRSDSGGSAELKSPRRVSFDSKQVSPLKAWADQELDRIPAQSSPADTRPKRLDTDFISRLEEEAKMGASMPSPKLEKRHSSLTNLLSSLPVRLDQPTQKPWGKHTKPSDETSPREEKIGRRLSEGDDQSALPRKPKKQGSLDGLDSQRKKLSSMSNSAPDLPVPSIAMMEEYVKMQQEKARLEVEVAALKQRKGSDSSRSKEKSTGSSSHKKRSDSGHRSSESSHSHRSSSKKDKKDKKDKKGSHLKYDRDSLTSTHSKPSSSSSHAHDKKLKNSTDGKKAKKASSEGRLERAKIDLTSKDMKVVRDDSFNIEGVRLYKPSSRPKSAVLKRSSASEANLTKASASVVEVNNRELLEKALEEVQSIYDQVVKQKIKTHMANLENTRSKANEAILAGEGVGVLDALSTAVLRARNDMKSVDNDFMARLLKVNSLRLSEKDQNLKQKIKEVVHECREICKPLSQRIDLEEDFIRQSTAVHMGEGSLS